MRADAPTSGQRCPEAPRRPPRRRMRRADVNYLGVPRGHLPEGFRRASPRGVPSEVSGWRVSPRGSADPVASAFRRTGPPFWRKDQRSRDGFPQQRGRFRQRRTASRPVAHASAKRPSGHITARANRGSLWWAERRASLLDERATASRAPSGSPQGRRRASRRRRTNLSWQERSWPQSRGSCRKTAPPFCGQPLTNQVAIPRFVVRSDSASIRGVTSASIRG